MHSGIKDFLCRRHPLWLIVPFFYGMFFVLNRLVLFVADRWGCDCGATWPMMIFPGPFSTDRMLHGVLLVGLLVVGGFLIPRTRSLTVVLIVSLAFVLLLNMMWGWWAGYVMPVDSWDNKLYTDALGVQSVGTFLAHFNERQLGLTVHGRTHPPGAVLFFYGLLLITPNPGFQAIIIAFVSLTVSQLCFYGTGRKLGFDPRVCILAVALFGVLPSVAIYYLASLDVVVAALGFGLLSLLVRDSGFLRSAGITTILTMALLLHFPALFFVPVVLLSEYFLHGKRVRPLILLFAVAVCLGILWIGWGYGWLESFRVASRLENPEGFLLLVEPLNYLMTRLEAMAEFTLFLGPAVVYLLVRGLRETGRGSPELHLFWIGSGSFLAMLAVGTYQTAEVARGAIFVLPFVLLPLFRGLDSLNDRKWDWAFPVMFLLTGIQAIVMQMMGIYIY